MFKPFSTLFHPSSVFIIQWHLVIRLAMVVQVMRAEFLETNVITLTSSISACEGQSHS